MILPYPFIAGACPPELIGPCAPSSEKREELSGAVTPWESTNAQPTLLQEVRAAGETVIGDATYLLTSPLRMDGKSALIAGGVGAMIAGLMVADKPIQRAFQENRTETGHHIADTLNTVGDAQTVLGANVALIGVGWLFREHDEGNKLLKTALVSLESQLFVEGISGLTKFAVGRARPNDEDGTHSFDPFHGFDKSFPSSHAARSFAMAAVFADAYPQPIPFLAYTGATLISLARIYENEHFSSDVFAGAALGFVIGKALSWRHSQSDSVRTWNVFPYVPDARGGLGLTVQLRF